MPTNLNNNSGNSNKNKAILKDNFDFEKFASHTIRLLAESQFKERPDGNLEIKHPASEIFDNLPNLLKTGVDTLTDQTDKEVFLYGALGCLSSIMPNVYGLYDGKPIYPHLYVYVLGNAGAGKGALEYARKLIIQVHIQKQSESEDENGHSKKRLFIPANNSSTGAIELLGENDGEGLIFETEGDTMANAFKSDFGNYSDTFRKGFHHEPILLYRTTEKKNINIEKPRIAAVLSSTFGQLLSLIPTVENGLFSRFLFHEVEPTDEFKDVFGLSKKAYDTAFSDLSERFLTMYHDLSSFEEIVFDLQDHHKDFFIMAFTKWKREIRDYLNNDFGQYDLDGTIHRLGLICFRVSMVLSTIRHFESGKISPQLICSDEDFYTAFRLVEIARNNALAIYTRLPKPKFYNSEGNNKFLQKADLLERAKGLQEKGMSYSDIAKEIFNDASRKGTIHKWLNEKR